MKVSVKGHIRDLLAFRGLLPSRRRRIARASAQPVEADPINELARQLHPERLHLAIAEVRDETKTTRTFRLVPDPDSDTGGLPVFFFAGCSGREILRRWPHTQAFFRSWNTAFGMPVGRSTRL